MRITPFLNLFALALLIFLMVDPPRGERQQGQLTRGHHKSRAHQLKQLSNQQLFLLCIIIIVSGEHEKVPKLPSDKKESIGTQIRSWGTDLLYLLKNKSYMFSTVAFTCLTYCTGALSWFGPTYVEKALLVRQEHSLEGFADDPVPDE